MTAVKQPAVAEILLSSVLHWVATLGVPICLFLLSPLLHLLWFLTDKVLWFVVGKSFLYNISWEDPQIDHRVLKLSADDVVVTLCSAGDNALDYLLEGARVVAVDLNPCQIALAELKALCVQLLCYDDYFQIFAENNLSLLRSVYREKLRCRLSAPSREFWDTYVKRVRSLMYAGSSGKLAFVLFRILFPVLRLGWIRRSVQDGKSFQEFQQERARHSRQLRIAFWLGEFVLMKAMCGLAGVPQAQLRLGLHRRNNIETIAHKILSSDLVNDNYFFGGYLTGRWTKSNCPRYMKEQNFYALRERLNGGRLKLYNGTLQSFLATADDGTFTVASLLDHMDWMAASDINSELALLTQKMNASAGRIFWRSFSEDVHSAPLRWLNPARVDDSGDRVAMYFSTWIAHLQRTQFDIVARAYHPPSSHGQGLLSSALTGLKIVSFPVVDKLRTMRQSGGQWRSEPQTKEEEESAKLAATMEAFYRPQKEGYDEWRELLLPGRKTLMDVLPLLKEGGMIWVDVGGGTARNLHYFRLETLRKYFKAIYIVDICESLLEVAADRVKQMNMQDLVHIVHGDFASADTLRRLPESGTVDVVTMSYSLAMMPNRRVAVSHCLSLLKPKGKGVIGVVDFLLHDKSDERLPPLKYLLRKAERSFHYWWFAWDNVYLLSPSVLRLISSQTVTLHEECFRGSVPWLPLLKPVHGVLLGRTLVESPTIPRVAVRGSSVDGGLDGWPISDVSLRQLLSRPRLPRG